MPQASSHLPSFLRFLRPPRAQKSNPPSWYGQVQAFVQSPGQPAWSGRSYARFAEEAYRRNVVAHRAIDMIASGAASVPLTLSRKSERGLEGLLYHPVLSLLEKPNLSIAGGAFLRALFSYRLIGGNAYLLASGPVGDAPRELYLLRPDRVQVLVGEHGLPAGYRYKIGERETDYPVDPLNGASRVLHLKDFHPSNDHYGLSRVEAAAYSIDQHNQAAAWNQSLLQNGARPSGALVVKMEQGGGMLSEDQFQRLKSQVDTQFSGPEHAGRPLLLEGGLDWKEMSLSPRDMDFIEAKHSAARDIALAFGVPPQLLGIPGDNTYANLAEARLALWEQTILPLLSETLDAVAAWLGPLFGDKLKLSPDLDKVSALSPRRESAWARVKDADFLSDDEKRAAVGIAARQS